MDRTTSLKSLGVIAAYACVQVAIVLFAANGPFTDEAIYITAGRRILEGFAAQSSEPDHFYWKWFQGSPYVWPPIAAIGYQIGGLIGARLMAVVFSTIAIAAFLATARALFGGRVALLSAVAFALNGQVIALGHFAVYDTMAFSFLSGALFAVVRGRESDERALVVLAGILFGAAIMTKYGYAIAFPALCLLILSADHPRRFSHLLLFTAVTAIVVGAYVVATFGIGVPKVFSFYLSHEKNIPRGDLALNFFKGLWLPVGLAAWGLMSVERQKRRWFVAVFLLTSFLVCCAHLVVGSHVSAGKHLAIGSLFLYLPVGLGLSRLGEQVRWGASLVLAGVALYGAVAWHSIEYSWLDPTPVSRYLAANWQPGDRLLAGDAWSHRMPLYWEGKIDSPFQVYDNWNVDRGRRNLCLVRWHIGENRESGSDRITDIAKKCGHRAVFEYARENSNPGSESSQVRPGLVIYERSTDLR